MNTDKASKENCEKQAYPLLAAHLRVWRKTKGWPLKRVADDLGVSKAAWNRWEKGSRFPSPAFITRLSQYLHLPVCRFFYKTSGPRPFCPLAKMQRQKKHFGRVDNLSKNSSLNISGFNIH